MRLVAGDAGAIGGDALVGVGDLHHGRLADHRQSRARQVAPEARDRVEAAGAAGLLIIAQHDMDRLFQRRRQEFRRHGEAEGVEALHVAGPASVESVAVAAQCEGRGRPFLARDRHDVGMARQHHAAVDIRPEGGEQRGLVAFGIGDAGEARAEAEQIILDEIDQRQVAARGFRVEGHQPIKQGDGPVKRGIGGDDGS